MQGGALGGEAGLLDGAWGWGGRAVVDLEAGVLFVVIVVSEYVLGSFGRVDVEEN